MGSLVGKRLGASGRTDAWRMLPEDLYSPRSNPKHPDHADWLVRTDPSDPEMVLLLASMREHGTDEGEPVLVYTDGGKTCVADGDRRHAACKIVNAERKAKREKPYTLRSLTTADPVLARALGNACRKGDRPMVIARRLRANMGAMATDPDKPETGLPAAAAACGVALRDARLLIRCLSLPPEIQARVGASEDGIPFDVAAGMASSGSEKATEAVSLAKLDGKGKVTRRAIKAAARKVKGAPKPRTKPAPVLEAIEAEARKAVATKRKTPQEGDDLADALMLGFAEGLAYARSGGCPSWAVGAVKAGEQARKAAKGGAS